MSFDLIPAAMGVVGLTAAYFLYQLVLRYPTGEGVVVEIAEAIHTGAMTFMRREYTILFIFLGRADCRDLDFRSRGKYGLCLCGRGGMLFSSRLYRDVHSYTR